MISLMYAKNVMNNVCVQSFHSVMKTLLNDGHLTQSQWMQKICSVFLKSNTNQKVEAKKPRYVSNKRSDV